MTTTMIRGNKQIMAGTITDTEISATAAIATSKLADGAEFLKRDGTVALTGNLSGANSFTVTNLSAPSNATDAVRKQDLDAVVSGLHFKAAVRVATTGAITLSGTQTIDGVAVIAGDRVLVKNQGDSEDNGIYVVAAGAWTRAEDANTSAKVKSGMFCFIEEGNIYDDTGWVLSTNNPIVLGTTELEFVQFSAQGVASVANVGTTGTGLYDGKVGSEFQFRNLTGSAQVAVTLNAGNKSLDLSLVDGSVSNSHIANDAAIARSKIAAGTASHVIVNDGSGNLSSAERLTIAQGGTNSSTALNNNRVMVSSSGAIVEAAAITASRALESNADGIPVASSVTSTELGYLSGVTSSIQTQLNNAGAAKYVAREVPAGLVNGVNDEFVLAETPVAGSEMVFLNGLLQEVGAGNDYTIVADTITFVVAPDSGDKISVTYFEA